MTKSVVFEKWMDYVSDGKTEEFEAMLVDMEENIVSLAITKGVVEWGNVVTAFELTLRSGTVCCLLAYEIGKETDGMMARMIAEVNYEIYLKLLWRMFGIEPFMNFDECESFEQYLEDIKEMIKTEYGKEQCRDGCEKCSICCHATDEFEEEC